MPMSRYAPEHQMLPATITLLEDGTAKVVFDIPQRAPAPGQSCVIYDGITVLGGGYISKQLEL